MNPFASDSPGTYNGLRVILDDSLVDWVEDWSQVRSPARARRRRAKHPQRIVMRAVPRKCAYQHGRTLIMHSQTWELLRELVAIGEMV